MKKAPNKAQIVNLRSLKHLLKSFEKLRVLVVGDCMLDHYIFGDAFRISPEAPVPVVQIERESYRPGGACNVALNLKELGAQVELMGWIGQDDPGKQLRQLLQKGNIVFSENGQRKEFETIIKTRVVVRNQQLCRLDKETILSNSWGQAPFEYLAERLKKVEAVIVSDYGKGCIDQTLLDFLAKAHKTEKFFLAVDPKPIRGLSYAYVDLLTPNRSEAIQMASENIVEPESLPKLLQRIQQKHPSRYLAITLGEGGILMADKSGNIELSPTLAKEVFDVSGAGDTVIAALTLALCTEENVALATHLANLAAGIVVSKVGTATVSAEEILSYA